METTPVTVSLVSFPPLEGYWLEPNDLAHLEKKFNCKFMGRWFLRDYTGRYDSRYDQPMDFFYTPDKTKFESGYFGVYRSASGNLYYIDSMTTFTNELSAIVNESGIFFPIYKSDMDDIDIHDIISVKVIGGDFIVVGQSDDNLDDEDINEEMDFNN